MFRPDPQTGGMTADPSKGVVVMCCYNVTQNVSDEQKIVKCIKFAQRVTQDTSDRLWELHLARDDEKTWEAWNEVTFDAEKVFLPVLKQTLKNEGFSVCELTEKEDELFNVYDFFGDEDEIIILLVQSPDYYNYLLLISYGSTDTIYYQIIETNLKRLEQ